MPGTLPVMNRRALELSLKAAALALNCEDRPLLPSGTGRTTTIPTCPRATRSALNLPFSREGRLRIADPKGRVEPRDVRIIRVHLEEDAGKSMHDELAGKADSRIDLNRAGTPLMEIVSYPDMPLPGRAKAYLTELKLLLNYLGVSDCNMQEGSLRVDANVNLHVHTPAGQGGHADRGGEEHEQLPPWSGRWLLRGPAAVPRSGEETGPQAGRRAQARPAVGTRRPRHAAPAVPRRNPATTATSPSRTWCRSLSASEEVAAILQSLGELPAQLRRAAGGNLRHFALRQRRAGEPGPRLVDYYIELAGLLGDGKLASNWLQQDVLRWLNERQKPVGEYPVRPGELGRLIGIVRAGRLTTSRGREVLAEMLLSGRSPEETMQAMGIVEVDQSDLESLCRELLEANPRVIADIKEGKLKAIGALIGQAKKKNPNVNANRFREMCLEVVGRMVSWRPLSPWGKWGRVSFSRGSGVGDSLSLENETRPHFLETRHSRKCDAGSAEE